MNLDFRVSSPRRRARNIKSPETYFYRGTKLFFVTLQIRGSQKKNKWLEGVIEMDLKSLDNLSFSQE